MDIKPGVISVYRNLIIRIRTIEECSSLLGEMPSYSRGRKEAFEAAIESLEEEFPWLIEHKEVKDELV